MNAWLVAGLVFCLGGPGESPRCPRAWAADVDFDADGDVDLRDYAHLQRTCSLPVERGRAELNLYTHWQPRLTVWVPVAAAAEVRRRFIAHAEHKLRTDWFAVYGTTESGRRYEVVVESWVLEAMTAEYPDGRSDGVFGRHGGGALNSAGLEAVP